MSVRSIDAEELSVEGVAQARPVIETEIGKLHPLTVLRLDQSFKLAYVQFDFVLVAIVGCPIDSFQKH